MFLISGCGGKTDQERVSQNPGRRLAIAALKNLGKEESESKTESNTTPDLEESHTE